MSIDKFREMALRTLAKQDQGIAGAIDWMKESGPLAVEKLIKAILSPPEDGLRDLNELELRVIKSFARIGLHQVLLTNDPKWNEPTP